MAGPGPRAGDQYKGQQPLYKNIPGPQFGGGGAPNDRGGAQYGIRGGSQFDNHEHQMGGAQYGVRGGGQFGEHQHQFGGGGAPYGGGSEVPNHGGRAQYGGNQGRYNDRADMNNQPIMNQAQYNDRIHMNNQPVVNQRQYDDRAHVNNYHPGMNQRDIPFGAQQGGRGVQDVPHGPKEAWSDKRRSGNQSFDIGMFH